MGGCRAGVDTTGSGRRGLRWVLGAGPRTLVKTIDITGREVRNSAHQMVFRLYSDGTTEKAIVGDRD